MKGRKNKKIEQAIESLDEILKRIGPYMPEAPKGEHKEERQWKLAKDTVFPLPCPPKHNHVTSPF
ncbi:MAG: hypothetical protein ACYS19_12215 [Planctomycetota bacterium]|jgi:hypothetical protein